MSEQIYFDIEDFRRRKQDLGVLRHEAASTGQAVIAPTRRSAGKTPAMLEEMAVTMMDLYQQVQELIAATEKMLTGMAKKLTDADESSAPL